MITLILLALLAGCPATDSLLYVSYLEQDLTSWSTYLNATDWEKADGEERNRILLYEYGYVPYLHSKGDTLGSRTFYQRFEAHITEYEPLLTTAEYAAYRSAAYAYSYMLGDGGLLAAYQSLRYAKKSVEADSLCPLALIVRGNVYFYAPHIAGGSKKKALRCFQAAERVMENDSDYRYIWIYPSTQLCIAQCLDKIGKPSEAKLMCKKILRLHPSFVYVREEYFPTLLNLPVDHRGQTPRHE
ncbi:MAG: hypothetical protein IJ838_04785 [Paludibacteraceae bacterium]|nr:hypothetical protein [Paludibacteraceae bacterium]